MKLQVVGPGCTNCKTLAERTDAAAKELGLEYELEKVDDIKVIVSMGIMRTPALVIDGETKLVGRVPSISELKEILST
jgi:small redox-active disulfide protein 2